MAVTRTFLAVDLSAEMTDNASELADRLKSADADVKWVQQETLHLTLKFLGDISDQEIAWVCQKVRGVCDQRSPFALSCVGAGAFPNDESPRTLWLGVEEGKEALESLQAELDEALVEGRFPRETRRFHPHVTLGRVKRGGPELAVLSQLVQDNKAYDAGSRQVDSVVVYASDLERGGPIYTPLARVKLTG